MIPYDDVTSCVVNLEFIQNQLRAIAQYPEFYGMADDHFAAVRDAMELLSARVSQWQESPQSRLEGPRERRQQTRRSSERRSSEDRRRTPNGAAA